MTALLTTPSLIKNPNNSLTPIKNTHAMGKYCLKLHTSCPKIEADSSKTTIDGVFILKLHLNKLLGIFVERYYVLDYRYVL